MKQKPLHPDTGDGRIVPLSGGRRRLRAPKSDVARVRLRADGLLAKRCVAGEVPAWEELYAQCHDRLRSSVRIMLGPQSSDEDMVNEIAARVWYALVANDGELLAQYDPRRGAKLITFMRVLAKDEIVRYFRAEMRRRKRKLAALRERSRRHGEDVEQPMSLLPEFLGTLTPHERAFCNSYLMAEPSGTTEHEYSKANAWQLTHRIHRKLLRFFGR